MSKQSQYDYNSDSERRTRRRAALIKLLAMLTFALTLWIFASAAWFSMNKNVDTSGMSVSVAGIDYIISVDSYNVEDIAPDQQSHDYADFATYYPLMTGKLEDNGYDLDETDTSTVDSIRWCLKEDNPVYSDHTGLRPGSYGTLTFYVEPVDPSSFTGATLHFDLSVTAYTNVEETANNQTIITGLTPLSANAPAKKYLDGHLLFFEENTNGIYSKMIDKEAGFSRLIDSDEFDENGKQQIDIYWIWPNTFSQMVLFAGASDLNDDPMFSSSQASNESYKAWDTNASTTGTPIERMKNYIIANYDSFFEYDSASYPFTGNNPALKKADVSTKMNDLTNNIILFNTGYNNADQIIGTEIRSIMVELNIGK